MTRDYRNGMPPVPGTDREPQGEDRYAEPSTIRRRSTRGAAPMAPQGGRQSYQQQQEPAIPYGPQPKKQRSDTWKGVVGGAVAGAAVSAALIAALMGTGVISTNVGTGGATTQPASSNQTISISKASDDATIAQAVAKKCLPSVVSVNVTTPEGEGIGSGVVIDADGNIITNWHVAGDATAITVTIDGQKYDATLVGGDASSDIAVIRAELNGALVTPMEIGDSSQLVVGDWVMTLGSPLGLDQSASSGIVSALYRNTLMPSSSGSGNTLYTNLIQTDAAINGGNSGGALVDDEGKLVGINTLYVNASGVESFSGIGFAIPGNYAVDIANKVIAGEQVTHAYIGLSCSTVNAQNAQANHLSVDHGAYVAEVAQGGPGAAAGIKEGDILTRIGDHDVASADDYILAIRSYSVGDEVDVTLMRGTEEQTVKVTLGSDEELQAQQAQQQEQQLSEQEELLRQYEEYLNQQQNNPQRQQSPWDSYNYQLPW